MRKVGNGLLVSGAVIGAAVGGAMLAGVHLTGVSWLVAVGLAKLTLVASGGLMATGAVCLRLDQRASAKALPRDADNP